MIMAEKKKAGRPKGSTNKKVTEKNNINENNKNEELIKQLMEQVANLTKQVEESKNEKNTLQQLVNTLQNAPTKKENELPSKVKVISLLENQLNLSTLPSGSGKVYTFNKLGDSKIIRLQDMEDILSIVQYREQAEKGYYYICDANIVEEFGLTEAYEHICTDKMIKEIETLSSDNSVDLFLGLNSTVKNSVAKKMAEDIANGVRLDRNKIEDIRVATNIDIEKMAMEFKEIKEKEEI